MHESYSSLDCLSDLKLCSSLALKIALLAVLYHLSINIVPGFFLTLFPTKKVLGGYIKTCVSVLQC